MYSTKPSKQLSLYSNRTDPLHYFVYPVLLQPINITIYERRIRLAPGFLAGPSGIRAGWVLETKSRLGAE